jgi:DNA-directed RNA polymerase subunit L
MINWKKWKNKVIGWIIYAHYGQEHPFCKHPKVDIKTVQPVTLRPKTGICTICKKPVKAKLVWETK